jgi:YHS domain-containing protein
MLPTEEYLEKCTCLINRIRTQNDAIRQVADRFTQTILSGRMVHLFGSGHSRIMVEEMWPRYGSFPGFNPMVELSLSFHHTVVGSNGQRQAMFLENVSGATYLFASEAHKADFDNDPAKYVPQYGGFCAYGVMNGLLRDVEGPSAFAVYKGKLYICGNQAALKSFMTDIDANIDKADENWRQLAGP